MVMVPTSHACYSQVPRHAGYSKWLVQKECEGWKLPLCAPRLDFLICEVEERTTHTSEGSSNKGLPKFKNLGLSGNESFLGLNSVASERMYLSCCLLVPAGGVLARAFSPQSGEDLCPQPVEDTPEVQAGCAI